MVSYFSIILVFPQMFEEDFNVFVDIPEDFEIRDRAKIKVSEDCQVRIADVLDEPQQAEQSRVTATYSLPAVPNDIKFSIERHQSGQYFRARSRVVQWLYHDLCLYTMYPGKLYNEAAQALVSRYPNLADSSGTGYDSWREALRFKAKYERRKIRIEQNDGADSPPSKKTMKDGKVATVGGNALQRVSRPSVATAPDGEDEDSIAGHIEGMKSAVQKARPDMAYIIDCMRRTFPTRRKWIGSEDPSVEVAIEKFPALAMSSIAQLEFELITSVPVLERLEEALQRTKEKIVHAARKKRHLEGFLEDFDARMDGTSEAAVYETTVTAAVCLLPSMVKERVETFVRPFDPAAVHYIPTVVHRGGILTTTDFSVCLEKICIKETSLLAAVATQMALYWAFNIVFDKKAQRSFDLLCRLINVDSGLRPTPLVRLAQTVLGK
ncbi:uncharacterized protein LOC144122256 [Amblyomma americanum]